MIFEIMIWGWSRDDDTRRLFFRGRYLFPPWRSLNWRDIRLNKLPVDLPSTYPLPWHLIR